jgi:hypothetical protein
MLYLNRILIRAVETNTYYFIFFMKRSSYSYKLGYEEYLKLICRYLLDDMYIELSCMKIPYKKIN